MGKLLDFLAIIGILLWGSHVEQCPDVLHGIFFMQQIKKETLEKLEDLLKVTITSFQYLIPRVNDFSGDLQTVSILIYGSKIVNVNVEGDSPEQIVKDVMKAIWGIK